jgi:hypothetical protein
MAENKPVIWVACEADYFSRDDWTGQISLKWREKSGCTRTMKLIRPSLLTSARDCHVHDRKTFVVPVLFRSGGLESASYELASGFAPS